MVYRAANGLLLQLVMDLKVVIFAVANRWGVKREEMQMLQGLSIEELHYIANSEVSVVSVSIDHANLASMLQRAGWSKTHATYRPGVGAGQFDRADADVFGLTSTDVAARRRIAGIEARSGRGNTLGDEDNAEIWRLWQKSGVEEVESPDGLDVMMLAAEQLNIPLTSVWHAVKGWHRVTPRRSTDRSPTPSERKRT